MVSALFAFFYQPQGAPCDALGGSRVSSPSPGSIHQPVRGQHHHLGLLAESGRHPFVTSQLGSAGHLASLRGSQGSVGAPVHSRAPECTGGHPESSFTGPRVGMDPLFSSFPGPSASVAGDNRPLCHFVEPSPFRLLLTDGGSAVGGHGCDNAAVGWSPGLCLPSFRPSPARHREGPAVSEVGAHVGGSILASTPLVSGPSGASGGRLNVPSKSKRSTQTASLAEPPRASPECVSYIERSARTFGFSLVVARQLARRRRSSTRVNYQAKWSVSRAWCARHGTLCLVPQFRRWLLSCFTCAALSLSYSSIASYRSMLSVVFCFVLPELSSHFVLRDLLRSFRLERLPSCRIPPWDLPLVLSFLRGPPLEPLSSCSLRDLTRKVLFLLSLATARRVGEL